MIESDTIKLLRECDAGAKMGVTSLNDVLGYVRAEPLKRILTDSKHEHDRLSTELQEQLDRFKDEGKDPPALASAMTELMTRMKLAMSRSSTDATIADLMTDGCNMGVKSLSRYLNQYKAADEDSKGIARRLISLEDTLAVDIRSFL